MEPSVWVWFAQGSPSATHLVSTEDGSVVAVSGWGGDVMRAETMEVLVPGMWDVTTSGLLAWDPVGNLRWSFLAFGAEFNLERMAGADGSLLASLSLLQRTDPRCVRDGLCLEPGEGALVLLEANGTPRWVRRLPRDAGPSNVLGVTRDPAGAMYVLTASALVALEVDGSTRWSLPIIGLRSSAQLVFHDGSLLFSAGVTAEGLSLGGARVRDCREATYPRRWLMARIDARTGDTLDSYELDDGLAITALDARSDGSIAVAVTRVSPELVTTRTLCGSAVEVAEGGEDWSVAVAVLR